MIEVSHLTKRYGSVTAVNNISFRVQNGEIVGFLGPNGAGKSTTMNILAGYISSSAGKAVIDGFDILDRPGEAKRRIGYLPEQPPLYPDMTVTEYLRFVFELKRCGLDRDEHIDEICLRVGLGGKGGRLIKNLSKGYRQRVGLAQALVGDPPVLILDEPTSGLDPSQIVEIRSLIRNLGQERTVILSTHILGEVQAICDRIILINAGKIVVDSPAAEISRAVGGEGRICLLAAGPEKGLVRMLSSIPGVKKAASNGQREPGAYEFILDVAPGSDVRREIFEALSKAGWPMLGLRQSGASLEDVFIQMTV